MGEHAKGGGRIFLPVRKRGTIIKGLDMNIDDWPPRMLPTSW